MDARAIAARRGGGPLHGGAGCLLVFGAVFVLYAASLQWGFHVQRQRNAAIKRDVDLVAESLAAYARSHAGTYPRLKELEAAVAPFLPDRQLPEDPWSRSQAALPVFALDEVPTHSGLDHRPWPSAAELARGKALPALGVHLYNGKVGCLIYDVTPDRRVYVLYGLGERSSPDSPFPLKSPRLMQVATNATPP